MQLRAGRGDLVVEQADPVQAEAEQDHRDPHAEDRGRHLVGQPEQALYDEAFASQGREPDRVVGHLGGGPPAVLVCGLNLLFLYHGLPLHFLDGVTEKYDASLQFLWNSAANRDVNVLKIALEVHIFYHICAYVSSISAILLAVTYSVC